MIATPETASAAVRLFSPAANTPAVPSNGGAMLDLFNSLFSGAPSEPYQYICYFLVVMCLFGFFLRLLFTLFRPFR